MKPLHSPVESFEDVTRNFEQLEQQHIYKGPGAPTFSAPKGAVYYREDTPTVANQWQYVNTAAGVNWVGKV